MFNKFKKSPEEKLQRKYKNLMEEAYKLSRINRKLSDQKYAEAEQVLYQIENIQQVQQVNLN